LRPRVSDRRAFSFSEKGFQRRGGLKPALQPIRKEKGWRTLELREAVKHRRIPTLSQQFSYFTQLARERSGLKHLKQRSVRTVARVEMARTVEIGETAEMREAVKQ
jgi:hypothetical protein